MDLVGKTVLVTGGAAGFGLLVAQRIRERGGCPAILDIDGTAVADMVAAGEAVAGERCDVSQPAEVERALGALVERCGRIHGLVNNAGILHSAPLLSIGADGMALHDVDEWNRVLAINLTSVFLVTRSVAALMARTRTPGVIVNVSSVSAAGNAGQSAYSAAKAGVEAVTVTWAKELGPWRIRVAGVAPGYCDTPSTHRAMPEHALDEIRAEMPLRRLGDPADIAATVLFLLENDFCNGRVFAVDGGLRV